MFDFTPQSSPKLGKRRDDFGVIYDDTPENRITLEDQRFEIPEEIEACKREGMPQSMVDIHARLLSIVDESIAMHRSRFMVRGGVLGG